MRSLLLVLALGAAGGVPGCTDTGGDPAAASQDSGDPRIDAALELIASGDHPRARALLAEVLERWPREGRALLYTGVAWQRQERNERARDCFERALRLGPTFPGHHEVWHFYGWCLLDLGELPGARQAFERHLEGRPDAADSHFGLGRIEIEAGNLAAAEARLRTAIELEDGDPRRSRQAARAHARLGDVHVLRDRLDEAERELLRAVELSPTMHQAHYKLYLLYQRRGESDKAASALAAFEKWKLRGD